MKRLSLIAAVLLLSGCLAAPQAGNAEAPPLAAVELADTKGEVDMTCSRDADCAVKNVGNCCGYFPACVNTAHEPDPEGVQEECRRKGMASICGFAEIAQCRCVAKQCEAVAGDSVQ